MLQMLRVMLGEAVFWEDSVLHEDARPFPGSDARSAGKHGGGQRSGLGWFFSNGSAPHASGHRVDVGPMAF